MDYRKRITGGGKFKNHDHALTGNNDLAFLTQPSIIEEIHRNYLEAGADIILTNTFSSTSIAQADYHLQHAAYDLNLAAASIAKKVVREFNKHNSSQPRFVAGSIGPTNRTASLSPGCQRPGIQSCYI